MSFVYKDISQPERRAPPCQQRQPGLIIALGVLWCPVKNSLSSPSFIALNIRTLDIASVPSLLLWFTFPSAVSVFNSCLIHSLLFKPPLCVYTFVKSFCLGFFVRCFAEFIFLCLFHLINYFYFYFLFIYNY